MAQNSFALMTNVGRAKEAAALANGTAVVITHIAIGDGTTVPSGGETSLYHEVARKAVSGHGTVVGASNVAYFDIFLEASEGPFTIREAGLIDQDGDLIAIAYYDPPISKPTPTSGQTVEGTVRLQVAFSNIANITIVVDPAFKIPIQRLTRLPWLPILSMTVTTPPVTPTVGDMYVVPVGATGAWTGQSGKIAEFTAAGWGIISPPDGHGIGLPDGRVFQRIDGAYTEKLARDSQSGRWSFAVAGGTVNALTATLAPAPNANYEGMVVRLRVGLMTNSGAVTLNVGPGALPVQTMYGEPLLPGALPPGGLIEVVCTGTAFVFTGLLNTDSPRPLRADTTLYVRTNGNDANDGSENTAAKAFRTIQAAINYAQRRFVAAGFAVRIKCEAGVYNEAVNVSGSMLRFILEGVSANPSTCSISNGIYVNRGGSLMLDGFQLLAGTSQDCLSASGNANVEFQNIRFGAATRAHIYSANGSQIWARSDYYIAAAAAVHLYAQTYGVVANNNNNVSINSGLTFTDAFAVANNGAIMSSGCTFAATSGVRYRASGLALINTAGGGANYFPGSSAGTTSSGAIYG
ncbi:phage tail protein [Brucella pseudogrignonensis]|uniref:phage tail-collar fiber domain-containing protein n=1 Tax=Brucella pseudogrignonensis TaxID=419475 RepID=UPI001E2F7E71|nr:phage tail protein [Brucella pseudogrignonensis]MCD4511539.1 phage tail protein [Brucella pseudogrignonensis]